MLDVEYLDSIGFDTDDDFETEVSVISKIWQNVKVGTITNEAKHVSQQTIKPANHLC